jgi:hypothetical protein
MMCSIELVAVLQAFSISDLIADWKSAARFICTQLDMTHRSQPSTSCCDLVSWWDVASMCFPCPAARWWGNPYNIYRRHALILALCVAAG